MSGFGGRTPSPQVAANRRPLWLAIGSAVHRIAAIQSTLLRAPCGSAAASLQFPFFSESVSNVGSQGGPAAVNPGTARAASAEQLLGV